MDEGQVRDVVEVLRLSHSDARFLLQKNNNDTARAIQEYFDNPDVLKQVQPPTKGWEDTQTYREPDIPGTTIVLKQILPGPTDVDQAFRIDASDNVPSNVRGAAPSRPPSRTSYRDEPIDLTPEHHAADPSRMLSSQDRDREERDFQAAIALSIGETPPGQESGITAAGQRFGRATGEFRDPERWAMTVSKATAMEVVEHPPPFCRRRKDGEPAFLLPSPNGGGERSLAALLTIYHSIPLAREALLLPNYQPLNYGYDSQWWTGSCLDVPRVGPTKQQEAHPNGDGVLFEVQRLMAFLDGTNRAYGSAEALEYLLRYYSQTTDSELGYFLEAWSDEAVLRSRNDSLTQVFMSHGVQQETGTVRQRNFHCLELPVDTDVDQSLTDPLDRLIWAERSTDVPMSDVWIDHLGHIMTFRLFDPKKRHGKLNVDIPAIWYPDRYMHHLLEISRDIRKRRRAIFEYLRRLDGQARELVSCRPASRQGMLDIKTVLANAAERAPLIARPQPQHGASVSSGLPAPLANNEVEDCAGALKALVSSIDTKLAQLDARKQELQAQIRATAEETNPPAGSLASSQHHRYSLRGVSTRASVTYILRPTGIVNQPLEAEGSTCAPEEWWRIASSHEPATSNTPVVFGPNPLPKPRPEDDQSINMTDPLPPLSTNSSAKNAQPSSSYRHESGDNNTSSCRTISYSIDKVSESDVLEAARVESDSIVLVYASEKAAQFCRSSSSSSTLSTALQMFVKADNRVFENELASHVQNSSPPSSMANAPSVSREEEMAQLHFSPSQSRNDDHIYIGVPMQEDKAPVPEQWRNYEDDNTSSGNGPDVGNDDSNPDPIAMSPPTHPPPAAPAPAAPPPLSSARRGLSQDGQPCPKRTKGDNEDRENTTAATTAAATTSSSSSSRDALPSSPPPPYQAQAQTRPQVPPKPPEMQHRQLQQQQPNKLQSRRRPPPPPPPPPPPSTAVTAKPEATGTKSETETNTTRTE